MVLSGAFESMGGTACFDTTTMPLIDSLSPRRRSGERVRERGFQLAAPIRWKVLLSPALSLLVPRRERERGGRRWWYPDAPFQSAALFPICRHWQSDYSRGHGIPDINFLGFSSRGISSRRGGSDRHC